MLVKSYDLLLQVLLMLTRAELRTLQAEKLDHKAFIEYGLRYGYQVVADGEQQTKQSKTIKGDRMYEEEKRTICDKENP